MDIDYYELLGISEDASGREVVRAYRKVALKYHPDKNPSPDAAEKFHVLSQALDTLSDDKLRAEYDQKRQVEINRRKKVAALGAEKRKLREDLEKRENAAQNLQRSSALTKQKLEMLRFENLQKVQQLKERKLAELRGRNVSKVSDSFSSGERTVKIKWNSSGSITADFLKSLFSRYGPVQDVIVSSKASNTALIEFKTISAAIACIDGSYGKDSTDTFLSKVVSVSPIKVPLIDADPDMDFEEYQQMTMLRMKNASMNTVH